MEVIFLKVLNMSIAAGWMILAVILIRFMLKNAPKAFRCIMWALVAVRLICPFSLESMLSLIPSSETISQEALYSPSPTISSGISVINQTINPVISESFAPIPGASVNPLQILTYFASVIWVFGITSMLLYAIFSYGRLYKRVRTAIRLQGNVWICDKIDSPFILGMLSPKIYLPLILNDTHRESVLAHENAHIKRHDHWWKPLGFLILSVYWFHPLIWIAYILLCRDIEMACDERVVKDMDAQEKKDYSKALLSCSVSQKMIAACPLAFGEVGVKARIKSILNYKKPGFWILLTAIVASVILSLCFLTNPKEKAFNTKTAGTMIEASCEYEVNVFALDDHISGYMFAGYTSEKRIGIAYFKYDEKEENYIFCGYDENYLEYPLEITVGDEIGHDKSVTVVASSQDEITFVRMKYGDEECEIRSSVSPVLVTHEWGQLLTEPEAMDIQISFYDRQKTLLDYSGPMVPYVQNPDGTWSADGETYQYRVILRGTTPNAAAESVFTVLTNDKNITFERVWKSLIGSHSDDWLDLKETRIVDLGTDKAVAAPTNDIKQS